MMSVHIGIPYIVMRELDNSFYAGVDGYSYCRNGATRQWFYNEGIEDVFREEKNYCYLDGDLFNSNNIRFSLVAKIIKKIAKRVTVETGDTEFEDGIKEMVKKHGMKNLYIEFC